MSDTKMMDWQPMETAPKDGTDVEILFNSAGTAVIRLCWYNGPKNRDWENCMKHGILEPRHEGWWSEKHSVTLEHIDYMPAVRWRPSTVPDPLPEPPEEETT